MNVYLTHNTARAHYESARFIGKPSSSTALVNCAHTAAEVNRALSDFRLDDGVIEVLVPSKDLCTHSSTHVCRVCPTSLPARPFRQLAQGVYLVSPELCFIQLAAHMDEIDIALFGSQLCANYFIDRGLDNAIVSRPPLTSKASLIEAIVQTHSHASNSKIKRASRFIVEGCNSPMEIVMALRLVLPFRLGGYSIPQPVMNCKIELSKSERTNSRLRFARGDAVWPHVKLDLEYDSSAFHPEDRRQADELRRNTLMHAGYSVISATSKQVASIEQFEQIVEIVARTLGKRIRKENKGATPPRIALVEHLFSWL